MSVNQVIPINKLIEALLDESKPFSPRYLHRLSDLEPEDATQFASAWPKVSVRRRKALLEDLEDIHLADDLQNFEAVARIGLNDKESSVRIRAISILREYELVDLLPTFIQLSEHDPDPNVRASAAEALATYIYMGEVEQLSQAKLQRVEDVLMRLVTGEEPALVQRKALEALGFSSREDVDALIEYAYTSGDIDWLISALFAMGRSANPHWHSRVLKMLEHSHPGVRAEAASAAGELEIREATTILLDLLSDADLDVRMAAIWALSQLGGAGVREALESQLEDTENDEEANQIGNALENLEFTEEMRDISLLEISEDEEDEDDSSDDEYDADIDDLISEDGKN